jgi:thioredoxin-dependent peroxiredoxin
MDLRVGDKIPDFKGIIDDNKSISLSDFRGKKLVLYFYPKDNTPGCTAESCNLRDHYSEFKSKNCEIIGISKDPVKSHKKFADKYDLPFPLIADEDLSIHKIFGTWVKKKLYGREYMGTARMTFIIDEEGMLEKVIEKVKTKDHANQILE